jgi:uncharacterized membrane-anchored protein YhcB (DUF1043 family)
MTWPLAAVVVAALVVVGYLVDRWLTRSDAKQRDAFDISHLVEAAKKADNDRAELQRLGNEVTQLKNRTQGRT